MDCSPPGSSVHGILQARILEWVSRSLLQGTLPTQGSNPGLPHCRQILYQLSHQGSPKFNMVYDNNASLIAQLVTNQPGMWDTWVRSLGWEDPLEKGTATYSSILAWRIPWTEELGGLHSMVSQSRT